MANEANPITQQITRINLLKLISDILYNEINERKWQLVFRRTTIFL